MPARRWIRLLLTVLLAISAGAAVPASGAVAPDGDVLVALGVLRPDMNGRPDRPITRVEMAVLLVRALGLDQQARAAAKPSVYADAVGQAHGYVALATGRGLMSGVSATLFAPRAMLTVAEALAITRRLLGGAPPSCADSGADGEVERAVAMGLVDWDSPLLDDPDRPVLRREVYALLGHALTEVSLPSGKSMAQTFLITSFPEAILTRNPPQGGIFYAAGKASTDTVAVLFDGQPLPLTNYQFQFEMANRTYDRHRLDVRNRLGGTTTYAIYVSESYWGYSREDTCGKRVIIEDKAIENVIRDAIGKPRGDLMVCDLERLFVLNARSKGIVNPLILEDAVNLVSLDLADNPIGYDLSRLQKLPRLRHLDLSGTGLELPAWLAAMSSLTELNLSENRIHSLSALKGLKNLTYLYAWNNQISDLTPLQGLARLEEIHLANNHIRDISPLVKNFADQKRCNQPVVDISGNRLEIDRWALQGPGRDIRSLLNQGVQVIFQPQTQ